MTFTTLSSMTSYAGGLRDAVEQNDTLEGSSEATTLTESSKLIARSVTGRSKQAVLRSYTEPEPSDSDTDTVDLRAPSTSLFPIHSDYDAYHIPNTKAISLTLVNSGSVARDHLASERTYLAYVRTSLALCSAGVALTQFLKLTDSTHSYAIPMGVVMILTGLLVLLFGTRRFFLVQRTLVEGYFPPSVLEVAVIAFILGSVVAVTFGVMLASGAG